MKYAIGKCKRVMEINGWLQGDIAKRAGVSQAVVSNFLTSKPVRRNTAKKIIERGLGLRVEDVLRGRVA